MTFQSNLNDAQALTQQNNIMNSFIQYYIDTEINKLKQILVDAAPENLDNLHELGQAIQAETERALAAEGLLDQHIDDEEAARAAAVTALEAAIAAEQARAEAAEEAEQLAREAAVAALQAALDALVASDDAFSDRLDVLEDDPTTKTYVDTQDSALGVRIDNVEADLTANYVTNTGLTIVAGDIRTDFENADNSEETARIAGDAATLTSANSYTDTAISDLVNGAGSALDTLAELGDALTDNDSEIAALVTQIGTVESGLAQEVTDRTNGDSALNTRVSALELDPVTFTQVTNAVNAEATSRSNADTALSGRLDTLEADPTTKTYVDTQDALALPKAGGNISVGSDVTFRYSDKLIIDSATELNLWSDGDVKIIPEEDYDILLSTQGTGKTKASNGLEVTGDLDVTGTFHGQGDCIFGTLTVNNAGSFTTPIIPDGTTLKAVLEAIGDAILARKTSVDVDAADAALSGRLDTLEADPTTQSAVDAKLNIASPAATGTLTVDTNASLKFDSNLTKVENVLRSTGINIGNNIEMNPAAAGGRVEINGDLILDASDLTDAADDTAAAAAGVVVGQVYHNSGALRIRLS
jgi:hypothetical protein